MAHKWSHQWRGSFVPHLNFNSSQFDTEEGAKSLIQGHVTCLTGPYEWVPLY